MYFFIKAISVCDILVVTGGESVAIYAISDLHLDYSGEKPMDIFGANWSEHEEKIFDNWNKKVKEDDLVLIPGDITWGLKMIEVKKDLDRIDKLLGKKIISKGNHDLWWQSQKKLNDLCLKTIVFLQNNHFIYEDIAVAATRGWSPKDSDEFDEHDEKVFTRELTRLENSLKSIKTSVSKKIVMLHYPPFNFIDRSPNEFVEIMKEHGVDICIYGHLHSDGHKFVKEGKIDGIDFHCVSSDYIDFDLKKIF